MFLERERFPILVLTRPGALFAFWVELLARKQLNLAKEAAKRLETLRRC